MLRHIRLLTAVSAALLVLGACGGEGEAAGDADPETSAADRGGEEGADGAAAAQTCADVDLDSPPSEPVPIRIGHGFAAEEPFWLMSIDESLTEHQGQWYEMQLEPFRGTEERLQAYQAGQLDVVSISPQAQIRGEATGGLDLYAIATIMIEGDPEAFSTTFVALEESGVSTPADLAGSTMAVVDVGSHLDYLARKGVAEGGGDPATGAEYVVFPFPAQEEALRGGQIEVAGLPEPFFSAAMSAGGVTEVFDAADVLDFPFDLLTLSFDRTFVTENLGAVCAWAADYAASMDYYRDNREEARSQLAGTDFVPLPEEVYQQTGDYARPEGGAVDTEGMAQLLDEMIEFGVLTEEDRIDVADLVLPGVTAGQ